MLAAPYVKEGQEGLEAPSACLEGAGHILAERLAEDADVRAWLRQVFHDTGMLHAALREERKDAPEALRFKPYWQFQEALFLPRPTAMEPTSRLTTAATSVVLRRDPQPFDEKKSRQPCAANRAQCVDGIKPGRETARNLSCFFEAMPPAPAMCRP